jgi:hypothetical protein
MDMFGVWCRVSGGFTGTREAWMKVNGRRAEYETREEAAEAAATARAAISPYSTASFSYTAQEIFD